MHAVTDAKLAFRAIVSFAALPGIVAGVIPWVIAWGQPHAEHAWILGMVVLVLGGIGLGWCVRDFFLAGRGTLAPWDPPRQLVIVGLYRFVRNPMYLSVLLVVAGWGLFFGSWALATYAAVLAVGFHLRVVLHEERWLARQFRDEWTRYTREVARWMPKWPHDG
ncbi:methyltransferase family protein [Opitutus terrae]|uniref:Isoprenylcysteine carboxyl methyltransferase n=1 Tax=Opitutus terrae (strain DSM 11246 / JCM 15787 / PB90-1) TaxID=452637 RepID=B1ZZI2_OPITP|nr:isoprenylcysteine carboxylmethyltransferase family protein [Opitutus terrae]ACB76385.1 conserved hypothetical protein [Opitutus terrae PB90-1]